MIHIEVVDIDEIIQRLWGRIKKPAAGKKSSIKLEKMLSVMITLF